MLIFDNRSPERTIYEAFDKCKGDKQIIRLAAPYFTAGAFTEGLLDKGCIVELILELNDATDIDALEQLYGRKNIEIRCFVQSNFHSKLYLIGEEFAIVGSANLTRAGFATNGEICVRLDSSNRKQIIELSKIFEFYWGFAAPLEQAQIDLLKQIRKSHKGRQTSKHQAAINRRLKQVTLPKNKVPSPISIKKSRERHAFKGRYNEILYAYENLRDIYEEDGRRRIPEREIPLLIEIDQFLSFLSEEFRYEPSYTHPNKRSGKTRDKFIRRKLQEWHADDWGYLEEYALPHYHELSQTFHSPDQIRSMNSSRIFEALWHCHAFRNYGIRFGKSKQKFKKLFLKENSLKDLRNSFSHLLHGSGGLIDRISDCIHDPDYKTYAVGKSTVSELVGWVNNEGLPIINGRTLKSLRYLGYINVPEDL